MWSIHYDKVKVVFSQIAYKQLIAMQLCPVSSGNGKSTSLFNINLHPQDFDINSSHASELVYLVIASIGA